MKHRFFILAALLTTATSAPAHQDRVLTLRPDGRLPEIPAEFGRAVADIRWPDDGPVRIELTVGASTYTVPTCVTELIRTRERRDVEFSGSWYPAEQRSAYYISMVFYDPGAEHSQMKGQYVWLTFDLLTARLRQVWVDRSRFLGLGRRVERDALTNRCSPEELKAAIRGSKK
ncbi:hypothetical protein PRJ39_16155 [Lysobacter enzymogenes]|uniref:hypothetical protein n=1 Tax=Lysobacter enzymogenes TaxID=69 RepID=UPI003749275D